MELTFSSEIVEQYQSGSQKARVLTENWVSHNMFCPRCGYEHITQFEANRPVADFYCPYCHSEYELKSKRSDSESFQATVADGVYRTMIGRITSLDNPSFFFMHYDRYEVNNLVIVPKCFFTPSVIEKRDALAATARRAGWEGCNILMREIPTTAKIPIIKNGVALPVEEVVSQYHRVFNLQTKSVESRGWLMDILHLVERLDETFTLKQMYSFVDELQVKHPDNNHIPDKIRQQLQFLRDKRIIEFKGRGIYKKI